MHFGRTRSNTFREGASLDKLSTLNFENFGNFWTKSFGSKLSLSLSLCEPHLFEPWTQSPYYLSNVANASVAGARVSVAS